MAYIECKDCDYWRGKNLDPVKDALEVRECRLDPIEVDGSRRTSRSNDGCGKGIPKSVAETEAWARDLLDRYHRFTAETARKIFENAIAPAPQPEAQPKPRPCPCGKAPYVGQNHRLGCYMIICVCGRTGLPGTLPAAIRHWNAKYGQAPEPKPEPAPEVLATPKPGDYYDIVFDGPPGPVSGRFIEVEDSEGRSFRLGEWILREDGLYALRVQKSDIRAPEVLATVEIPAGRCVTDDDAHECACRLSCNAALLGGNRLGNHCPYGPGPLTWTLTRGEK